MAMEREIFNESSYKWLKESSQVGIQQLRPLLERLQLDMAQSISGGGSFIAWHRQDLPI